MRALLALAFALWSCVASAQLSTESIGPGSAIEIGPGLSTGSGVPAPSFAGLSNYNTAYLSNYNAALAAVKAGTRNAKVVLLGDSTTAGWGGGGYANSATNARLFGVTGKLPFLIANSSNSSWFADNNVPCGTPSIQLGTFDPHVSQGSWSSVANDATYSTVAGSMQSATSATGGPLAYTPSNQVDTFVLYTPTNTTLGGLTYQVDSGSTTAINENAAKSVVTTTISTTLGAHTLNLNWVSGTTKVLGVYAYNSAAKEVSILNWGWSCAKVTTTIPGWTETTSSAWDPLTFLQSFAPDLTIINLTINDWNAGTNTTTYQTDLQAIITAAKVSGDCILMSAFPTETSTTSSATQATYIAIVDALAASNNCIDINLTTFFTSWANASAHFQNWDDRHPNGYGYSSYVVPLSQVINQSGVAPVYDIDSMILASYATTPPTAPRETIISNTIAALKSDAVWGACDAIYLTAAADSQIAKLNWKAPSLFTLINVGAGPSFIADRGFTGNGTSTALDTHIILSAYAKQYSLNSGSLWLWSLTAGTGAVRDIGGTDNPTGDQDTILVLNASNNNVIIVNTPSGGTASNPSGGIGFFGASRVSSATMRAWREGTQLGTDYSIASAGIATTTQWMNGFNATSPSFSARQEAAAAWCNSLSGKELAFRNDLYNNYIHPIGAQ